MSHADPNPDPAASPAREGEAGARRAANRGPFRPAQDHISMDVDTARRRLTRPTNPTVPLMAVATAGVLGAGFRSFLKADPHLEGKMMGYRVAFQAATVGLLLLGVYAGFK